MDDNAGIEDDPDYITNQLRYINRVRSMLPSPAALAALAQDEADLLRQVTTPTS